MNYLKEVQNEREFKPLITDEILKLPKKPSNTREASIISGPQLKIKNQIIIPLDLQKRSSKIREYFHERYTVKCNTTDYGVRPKHCLHYYKNLLLACKNCKGFRYHCLHAISTTK